MQPQALPPEVLRKLGELGFLGMLLPEEYGGMGLDSLAYLLALEEIAAADASVAVAMSAFGAPSGIASPRSGRSCSSGAWPRGSSSSIATGRCVWWRDDACCAGRAAAGAEPSWLRNARPTRRVV